MSIPREDRSSATVLYDARYHRASVKADPATAHLGERVEVGEGALRARVDETRAAEDARLEAYARLVRADFALDQRVRQVELQVLAAVARDRTAIAYRACFPRGLSDLVAMRGEEQERAVRSLVTELARFPELAAAHGEALTTLAADATTAERAWQETERLAAVARGAERLARVELIRALQRNEGALRELFPGDKRSVRSFFRKDARRAAKPAVEE